jgi:PKD repeat protein
MKKLLLTLFTATSFFTYGQKEAWHWYFGNHAGLDFSSGSPVADMNSAMYTDEGCASISDASGLLQFYTGGTEVYNRNHTVMPNGNNLNGSTTSSQSAMIVKQPGNANIYYIFTTDGVAGVKGLCYSTVDMTLNAGLGDVVIKNQQLMTPTSEHLTATFHANGTDIWVMAHDTATNYYAYLVTSVGVSAPVITSIGFNPNTIQGSMKFSPAGDKLACPFQDVTLFEVYDFDNATGILSNVIQLNNGAWLQPFAVEFSPSGRFLYAVSDGTGTGSILQFDLSLGTQAAITASGVIVGAYTLNYFGSLQLGPDMKLYAGELNYDHIGVINYPDSPGVACNFVMDGVYLGGAISQYGLPNFITGYFNPQLQPIAAFFADNHLCPGTCTDFQNNSSFATSYQWQFPGANPSVSTDENPTNICYNTPGSYSVTIIATNALGSDTLTLNNFITVYPFPSPQGIMQSGDTLFANAGAVAYQWYQDGILIPGATEYFYLATSSGNYNVVATDNNGCEVEAVIFDVIAKVQSPATSGQFMIKVYPNPVSEKLIVQCFSSKGNSNLKISIYNAIGEIVMTSDEIANQNSEINLDVENLAKGIYWIEAGIVEKVFREKFIKE